MRLDGVALSTWLRPAPLPTFDAVTARPEQAFDHLVVVMFENRSFDNILGWLYPVGELPAGASFDGLHQGSYSNPGV